MTSKPAPDRSGPREGPERTCIATGAKGPPEVMIRFGRSPDGVATPDLAGKLPGRGAWVSANREAIDRAIRKGAFARGFKAQTTAPDDLADVIEAGLAARLLAAFGLARRAGDLVLGFDQVKEALQGGKCAVLIEAADGAKDGREKLLRIARGVADRRSTPILCIGCLDSVALGLALGRDRVVHLALQDSASALRVASEARRLSGFRALVPEDWRLDHPDGAQGAASSTAS